MTILTSGPKHPATPTNPKGPLASGPPSSGAILTDRALEDYALRMTVPRTHTIHVLSADPWAQPKVQCACGWEFTCRTNTGRVRDADTLLDEWLVHRSSMAKVNAP